MADAPNMDRVAQEAADRIGDPEFADKLKGLSEVEIQIFVAAVEASMRRRRLMLTGMLAALTSLVLGSVFAVIVWLNRAPGQFVWHAFLLPFALAGLNMWVFGKLARRIKVTPEATPQPPRDPTTS